MNKEALSKELKALATAAPDDRNLSKAARLRAVLPDVEAALNAGNSHAKVLETLKAHGLDMTLAVFNTTLRRIRASKGKYRSGEQVVRARAPSVSPAPRSSTEVPVLPPETLTLHAPSEPVDLEELITIGKRGKS